MLEARVDLSPSTDEIARHHRRSCPPLELPPIDLATHAEADLAWARRFWLRRMASEHRSVQVFLQLAGQLVEAGAPLDAQAVMIRLAHDEVRHTELCGQVVARLGGEPAVVADVAIRPLAGQAGCSPLERALRNTIYATCLSEMIACARLVDALDHTTDETVRAATRAILADEVMHGSFGFHYLETCRPALDDDDLRASLAVYLRHGFAVLERELAAGLLDLPRPTPGAMALGVIDPRRALDVFHNTIAHAIVPALERHRLAAGEAWRDRHLATQE